MNVRTIKNIGEIKTYKLKTLIGAWKFTRKEIKPFDDCLTRPTVSEMGTTRWQCLTPNGWTYINEGDFIVKIELQGQDIYRVYQRYEIDREFLEGV